MKLEVKRSILNLVSVYDPQVSNSMEKNDFWQDLNGLIESALKQDRIVLGEDPNGHVGEGNIGDEEIMGRYGAGTRRKDYWLQGRTQPQKNGADTIPTSFQTWGGFAT